MDREIPFFEEEICDYCGKKGAYDFIGDFLCEDCTDEYLKDLEEGGYDA